MSDESGRFFSTRWSWYGIAVTTVIYTITWIVSCWAATGRADKLAQYSNWTNYTNSSLQHKAYASMNQQFSDAFKELNKLKTVDVTNAIQTPAIPYVTILETYAGTSNMEIFNILYLQPCHFAADRVLQIFTTFAVVGAVFVAVFLILMNILVWTKALESSPNVSSWSLFFTVMFLLMFTFTSIIIGLLSMELFYNMDGTTIRTCLRNETNVYGQAMSIFILLFMHIIIWIVIILNNMVGHYMFPLSSEIENRAQEGAAYPYTYHGHGMNS